MVIRPRINNTTEEMKMATLGPFTTGPMLAITLQTSPAGPHYIYTRSHASLGFWMAGRSVVDLPLTSKKRACGCNGVLGGDGSWEVEE